VQQTVTGGIKSKTVEKTRERKSWAQTELIWTVWWMRRSRSDLRGFDCNH